MVITMVITTFYFFPFEFVFLPAVNTKMAMAAIGLVLLGVRMARSRGAILDKDFFMLSLWALGVSLAGFLAVVYNDTNDYTYASYVISMWVWASAAYAVVQFIRNVHGSVSVILIANYLIAVCVLQCILALMIDRIPAFEHAVNSVVSGLGFVELETLDKMDRLYGIGASLDVAGTRFSAVLVLIAYIVTLQKETIYRKYVWVYIVALIIIGVIGNMMSRTTTVGLGLFIFYVFYKSKIYQLKFNSSVAKLLLSLGAILIVVLPFTIYFYNIDDDFHNNIRFAFEGFFSLIEKGKWDVHSNEILKNMYVFPDNFKTWIIGDGYFDNPYYGDPFYTGIKWGGFYHGTDVGYLRFIYYFGLVGLSLFCLFFIKVGHVLVKKFSDNKFLFLILISLNFIIWFKVSTDIFVFYALFLMIDKKENEEYDKSIVLEKTE